jgi:hypothetical protein
MAVSAGFVLLAAGLGATVIRDVRLDKVTGCPINNRAPAAHTVILVDETDRLGRADLRYARELIMTEYGWLPVGGRLTVRNIRSDPDQAEDIVVCRMRDKSATGGLTSNSRQLKKQFDRTAGLRLNSLLADLETAPVETRSPIRESIAAVADRTDFSSATSIRRLIVLSDFAQHSGLDSDYDRRRRVLSAVALDELTRDFSEVEIRLHYIRRPSLNWLQGDAHRRSWETYLEDMGAHVAVGHDLRLGETDDREVWINAAT